MTASTLYTSKTYLVGHADPPRPHGPYYQWTRKKDGKTATRILTDDQLADYQPWFDNHRRLRTLIAELEALSLGIAEADPAGTGNPCGLRLPNL